MTATVAPTPADTAPAGVVVDGMRYRPLGPTGLPVSAIGLGTWATFGETLDDRAAAAVLGTARDGGVNLLDTAETYADGRSEEALGRALRMVDWPRETFAVCAKVFWGTHGGAPMSRGLSRKHVTEGAHATLRRLGLDHLDLLLCHRPDPLTPVAETVRAMSDLVTAGAVLYWGTSEWSPTQVEEAIVLASRHGWHGPVTEQLQYNLLVRDRVEADFAPLLDRGALGLMTWSPLAYGLLAGRYTGTGWRSGDGRLGRADYDWLLDDAFRGDERGTLDRVERFCSLADQVGIAPAVLAIGWVLRNEHVDTAVCGASRPQQLAHNLAAGRGVPVDDDLWHAVETVFRPPTPAVPTTAIA